MRPSVIRCLLPLLASAGYSACISPVVTPPAPGILTADITPLPVSLEYLSLSMAAMRLEHFSVFGDTPPPMMMPPPMGMPPTDEVDFDALSTGNSISYSSLSQGVYSRVQFIPDSVQLSGTWRGTPFQARLAMYRGPMVDLRSATGQELGPGQDAAFAITVDPNTWFAGDLLDSAMSMSGRITCDQMNNQNIGDELTNRIANSFLLK